MEKLREQIKQKIFKIKKKKERRKKKGKETLNKSKRNRRGNQDKTSLIHKNLNLHQRPKDIFLD